MSYSKFSKSKQPINHISKPENQFHLAGKVAENLVAQECRKRGYQIIYQNKKIMGIECDIICTDQSARLLIIEVKTIHDLSFLGVRVSPRQTNRIKRVLSFYLENNQPAYAHLACVHKNSIYWIYNYFIDN